MMLNFAVSRGVLRPVGLRSCADEIITGEKRGYFSPKGKKRPNCQPTQRNPEIGHIVPFFGVFCALSGVAPVLIRS